jgi:virginiamycin B lyase
MDSRIAHPLAVALALAAAGLVPAAATAGPVTEINLPAGTTPRDMVVGPDDALWFTAGGTSAVGRLTTGGQLTEYPLPTPGSGPTGITLGSDGNLWVVENSTNKVARMTPAGAVTGEFNIPTPAANATDIATGPDGNLWVVERDTEKLARITPVGGTADFPTTGSHIPDYLTPGPDGELWYTETSSNTIGRMTVTGIPSELTVPGAASNPQGIVAGSDGALWFAETAGHQLGRVTTSGSFSEFALPAAASSPVQLGLGQDGAIWYTTFQSIARWTLPGAVVYAVPGSTIETLGTPVAGPDGNLWFIEGNSDQIGRVSSWGPSGPTGPQGGTGPQGAQGPAGPKGARGAPGRNARVTCRVVKPKKKSRKKKPTRVVCTVRLVKGSGKVAVRAQLLRGRHTVGKGHAKVRGRAAVSIRSRHALRPATYFVRLTFTRGDRHTTRVIQLAIT